MDEEGSITWELDRYYRLLILRELRKNPHSLTHQSDSLYNIVNGQVVSETEVNVQDAVEIGQDTRTSFASSLPEWFYHPIKKSWSAVWRSREKLSTAWKQFSYLPRSLTSTTASEKGVRQCARVYWECTHFQEATQSHIYPNGRGKVSALRVLTQTDIDELDSVLGEGSANRRDLLTTYIASFCHSTVRKKAPRWMLPGMKYTKTGGTRFHWNRSPTNANLALHVQRAHLQMLLWKAADKSDPPDAQLTDYGWEVKEHENVMPAISREPAVPSKLMDVVRCSCKAEGKLCSGRCSYGSNGMLYTSYCVCEGGMLVVTHILNRRRTKATHNWVKWITMILRGKRVLDWAHDRRY